MYSHSSLSQRKRERRTLVAKAELTQEHIKHCYHLADSVCPTSGWGSSAQHPKNPNCFVGFYTPPSRSSSVSSSLHQAAAAISAITSSASASLSAASSPPPSSDDGSASASSLEKVRAIARESLEAQRVAERENPTLAKSIRARLGDNPAAELRNESIGPLTSDSGSGAGSHSRSNSHSYSFGGSPGTHTSSCTTSSEAAGKQAQPYPGLRNMGATCYLNSLLQSMYAIDGLREALFFWERDAALEEETLQATIAQLEEEAHHQEGRTQQSTRSAPRSADLAVTAQHSSLTDGDCDDDTEEEDEENWTDCAVDSEDDEGEEEEEDAELDEKKLKKLPKEEKRRRSKTTTTTTTTQKKRSKTHGENRPHKLSPADTLQKRISAARRRLERQQRTVVELRCLLVAMGTTIRCAPRPAGLTRALSIDPCVQQDAHEFLKLLLTFLEEKPLPNLKETIHTLFRGQSSYLTMCTACKRVGTQPGSFYELALHIDDGPSVSGSRSFSSHSSSHNSDAVSVTELLLDFLQEEVLDGYQCDGCKETTQARRSIALTQLPEVLNIQLLRFVYDLKTQDKKKISRQVSYPMKIDMSAYLQAVASTSVDDASDDLASDTTNIYHLRSVISHIGSSAHGGHYICYVKREDNKWWCFDDSRVSLVKDRLPFCESTLDTSAGTEATPKTTSTLHSPPSFANNYLSRPAAQAYYGTVGPVAVAYPSYGSSTRQQQTVSLSAGAREHETPYLLFYARQEHCTVSCLGPLDDLKKVENDNVELLSRIKEWYTHYRRLLEDHSMRTLRFQEVLSCLAVLQPDDDCRWIEVNWLRKYLKYKGELSATEFGPIPNELLLCPHSKLTMDTTKMKRISPQAWTMLESAYGGGPTLSASECCVQCVKEWQTYHQRVELLSDQRREIAHQVNEAVYGPKRDVYWISREWYNRFVKTPIKTMIRDGFADDFTADITCEHGNYWPGPSPHNRKLVPKPVWELLCHTFPIPPCHTLALSQEGKATSMSAPPQPGVSANKGERSMTCADDRTTDSCSPSTDATADRPASASPPTASTTPDAPRARIEYYSETTELCPICVSAQAEKNLRLERDWSVRRKEREQLMDIYNLKLTYSRLPLYAGRQYLLIASQWLRKWRLYLDNVGMPHPGPIDNSPLFCAHSQVLPNVNSAISRDDFGKPGSVLDLLTGSMWTRLVQHYGVLELDGRSIEISYSLTSLRHTYDGMRSRMVAEGTVLPGECAACQEAAELEREHNRTHFQDGYVLVRKKRSFFAVGLGHEVRIPCSCDTTLGELKLLIMQHLDIQPCVQLLRSAKRPDTMLGPDSSTLLEHDISLGSVIEVEIVDEVEAAVVAGKLGTESALDCSDPALAAAMAASAAATSGTHACEQGFRGTTLQTSVFDSSEDLTDSALMSSSPSDLSGFLGSPTSRRDPHSSPSSALIQSDEWRCVRCTLHNKNSISVCGACDASRPTAT